VAEPKLGPVTGQLKSTSRVSASRSLPFPWSEWQRFGRNAKPLIHP